MFVCNDELDVGVERRAKLFEVGEYPDKGVTVSRRDLLRLAANFDEPVPVLIEHGESPLRLGELIEVEPVGGELFGTIRLSSEANALIESSGARALSIGLSPDLSAIREVSLVRNPRVPTARMFADSVGFAGGGLDVKSNRTPIESNVDVERLVRQGRVAPSQVPLAKALLSGDADVSRLMASFLERQPALTLFTAITPTTAAAEEASAVLMLPEEAAFYRKHFPDVPLDLIAQRR